MKELLETFSLTEIVVFMVLLAGAIKGLLEYKDFFSKKMTDKVHKEDNISDTNEKIDDTINAVYELGTNINQLTASIEKLEDKVNNLDKRVEALENNQQGIQDNIHILIASDKDDIKSWITEKHHFFIEQGWIDNYSLDCIEKRFTHYKEEGGNSFIEDLMEDIRALEKR